MFKPFKQTKNPAIKKEPKPKKIRTYKIREKAKRFARLAAVGSDVRECARLAGYADKSSESYAYKLIKSPQVQNEMVKVLDKAGLSDDAISDKLTTIINNGLLASPTASDSLRGLDMVLRLKDRYPQDSTSCVTQDLRISLKAKSLSELQAELDLLNKRDVN